MRSSKLLSTTRRKKSWAMMCVHPNGCGIGKGDAEAQRRCFQQLEEDSQGYPKTR